MAEATTILDIERIEDYLVSCVIEKANVINDKKYYLKSFDFFCKEVLLRKKSTEVFESF